MSKKGLVDLGWFGEMPFEHGHNCPKVAHAGGGYLHGEDDDTPYDVDGVRYCGRCHKYLDPALALADERRTRG